MDMDDLIISQKDETKSDSPTILLVDDDKLQLLSFKKSLSKFYNVLVCSSARNAIDTYKLHKDSIKTVVSDIRMPDISGFELYDRIKKISDEIPVIFITGYQEEYGDAQKVKDQYKIHGYIVKNDNDEINKLRDAIKSAISEFDSK